MGEKMVDIDTIRMIRWITKAVRSQMERKNNGIRCASRARRTLKLNNGYKEGQLIDPLIILKLCQLVLAYHKGFIV